MLMSFFQGSSAKVVVSNAMWLCADKVLRLGVGLIVGVWVARYLGPEQYGLFSYALAIVALLGSVASWGLDAIVVRDIVKTPSRTPEILGTCVLLRLFGGAISFLLALAIAHVLRPADQYGHVLVAILAGALLIQAFDVIDVWLQSQMKNKLSVYAKNGAFAVFACVKVFLIWVGAPLITFAWAVLAEAAVGTLGLICIYTALGKSPLDWRVCRVSAKQLFNDGWPLAVSGMAIMTYVKVDQIMLAQMIDERAVGVYAAAARISEIWYFVPTSFAAALAPWLVRSRQNSATDYHAHLQRAMSLFVLLSYAFAAAVTLFSGAIVELLYGPPFQEAGAILSIHVWSGVFVALGVARGTWIVIEGLQRLSLLTTMSGALVNILLNLWLIPHFGAIGAAVATLVSYGFSDYLIFFLLHNKCRGISRMMSKALLLQGLRHGTR